jgi:hypothetical protein
VKSMQTPPRSPMSDPHPGWIRNISAKASHGRKESQKPILPRDTS